MWKSKHNPKENNDANIILLGGITHEHEWVGTFERSMKYVAGTENLIYGACAKTLSDGDTSYSVYILSNGHIEKIGSVRKSQLTSYKVVVDTARPVV